jgi:hypothetical protein
MVRLSMRMKRAVTGTHSLRRLSLLRVLGDLCASPLTSPAAPPSANLARTETAIAYLIATTQRYSGIGPISVLRVQYVSKNCFMRG